LRPQVLAVLRAHPEHGGLTAQQLKVHLQTDTHIGDVLAGMVRSGLLVKTRTGKAVRYRLAKVV
jgi:hypothetical protein